MIDNTLHYPEHFKETATTNIASDKALNLHSNSMKFPYRIEYKIVKDFLHTTTGQSPMDIVSAMIPTITASALKHTKLQSAYLH